MAQLVIEIKGPPGAGKSEMFKTLARGLIKSKPSKTIFGFDGEGRRMTADDRRKASKADIVIITRQTYKLRKKGKKK